MLQFVTFLKPSFFSLQITTRKLSQCQTQIAGRFDETVVPSCDEALFPASFNFLGNNV
jgi:hypothetical protein